jgi:hypothetical protein
VKRARRGSDCRVTMKGGRHVANHVDQANRYSYTDMSVGGNEVALTRLFGDRLADPDDRFEMEIALRALAG